MDRLTTLRRIKHLCKPSRLDSVTGTYLRLLQSEGLLHTDYSMHMTFCRQPSFQRLQGPAVLPRSDVDLGIWGPDGVRFWHSISTRLMPTRITPSAVR